MASPLDEVILRLFTILSQEPDVFPLQSDFLAHTTTKDLRLQDDRFA
jgi:hypothetical protein